MSLFKRIFNIGKAEANSLADKLEDPIKQTEQGIRDMKKDLEKSLESLAELKSAAIRSKKEMNEAQQNAKEYEQKAMKLLEKEEELGKEEAERLAQEALNKKKQLEEQARIAQQNKEKHDQAISQMDGNIRKLRNQISNWENELKTLKARHKVSNATKKLNKQLANTDSSGTISTLERMKEKVDKQEAESEAYADIANEPKSVDDEIESALGDSASTSSEDLDSLRQKMKQGESKK